MTFGYLYKGLVLCKSLLYSALILLLRYTAAVLKGNQWLFPGCKNDVQLMQERQKWNIL